LFSSINIHNIQRCTSAARASSYGVIMLHDDIINAYCAILEEELVPAMGCTEPIAVAFAAAKARQILGFMPDHAEIFCSPNIVKNVKSVTVPNTGGMKGIETAVIAGILANAADLELSVLQALRPEDRARIAFLKNEDFCTVHLAEDIEGLYIDLRLFGKSFGKSPTSNAAEANTLLQQPQLEGRSARVVVKDTHTNISLIEKDGIQIYPTAADTAPAATSDSS